MKVLVEVQSSLTDATTEKFAGRFFHDKGNLFLSWVAPDEISDLRQPNAPVTESTYTIEYTAARHLLTMRREGVVTSNLSFIEGQKTKGVLSTDQGDFEMEIMTKKILIPGAIGPQAVLTYDILYPGQEPMENVLRISLTIANSTNSL
ncbi:MAG TPA: DUF1934 domain-containing protein [Bacillota bacterium]|nr:DUF1934 domain-containing protein [Bacillota bacterium]HPE38364.1 DUF1934 domain-containing protein [Bacillota bacterium]